MSRIRRQQRGPLWPARVWNVSASGIGLLVGRALEPGIFLAIHLGPESGFARPLQARVVHSTAPPAALGWVVVGCRFSRQLSPEEVQELT